MSKKEINVDQAILNVFDYLIANPMSIYAEYDLQMLLCSELLKMDDTPYLTGKLKNYETKLKTQRIHVEYPCGGHNYDIVVFDPDDIKNINDNLGYLFVCGEDCKGNTGKSNKLKRSVLFTDLIELKKPVGGLLKKNQIRKDLNFLRRWLHEYEYFQKQTNLYFVCYILWKTNNSKMREQATIFEKIMSEVEQEKLIKIYLLIGPKEFWKNSIEENIVLKKYFGKNIYLV